MNHESRIRDVRWLIVPLFFIALFIIHNSLFIYPAFAQTTTDITGLEKLEGTGLSSVDPRVTVGRVIQAFLGLLGVVAIALIIYAGFLWMTSRENEETIAKAKKLLLNAVIGLGIILGAFAITTFIMSKLLEGTGLGGTDISGPGDSGGGGGRLPVNAFTVRSIQPNTPVGGTPTIRNAVVRLFFTKAVDGTTVDGNVRIVKVTKAQDGSTIETPVIGEFATKDTVVEFTPGTPCAAAGEPNATLKCFDESSDHRVEAKVGFVKSTVVDAAGKQLALLCGTGGCKATFTTGTVVDTQSPTIEISNPFNNQYLPAATSVPIDFTARDDGGISSVEILIDNVLLETLTPVGTTPLEWSSGINWDTGSIATPSHTIKARVVDIDTNTPGESLSLSVNLRAAHCFNKTKDATETDVDCGGADCGACNGESCTGNADCASGACDTAKNQCVEYPIITRVSPLNGVKGNLITILGRGFGATQGGGKVEFLGKDGTKIADLPQACSASDLWRNDRIIVAVPDGVSEGPLKVTNADTLWDDTKNDRGQKYTFTPSNVVRPGLCRVTPEEGTFGTLVTLRGVNFTATKGAVLIDGDPLKGDLAWGTDTISGVSVPNLEAGNIEVAVESAKAQGSERSNPLFFHLKEPVGLPRVETIDPLDGRPGTYVTIRGSNFGATGKVYFINEQGGETIAPPNFPEACMVTYWAPSTITVPVPSLPDGAYDIVVERENRDNRSNNKPFAVKQNRDERPGICRLEPDNGPEGLTVMVLGDRFGAERGDKSKVTFLGTGAAADDKNAILKKWEYQSVQVQVPLLAKTGKVQLIDSSGTTSNTFPFTVQDCRQWGCEGARECCGNGVCQERGTCTEGPPACTLNWKFSTGAGGGGGDIDDDCTKNSDCAAGLSCDLVTKTCQDTLPHVVEQEECKSAITGDRKDNVQSPSPYRESIDACTTAQLAVRFTMNMNDGALRNTQNTTLVKCNAGERLKPAECTTRVGTSFLQWISHDTNNEGALFAPGGGFAENTWYRVILNGEKGGLTSVDGKLLDGDRDGKEGGNYEWTFHTKKGTCALDHVRVTPRRATISDPTGSQDYTGIPTAENCNVLNPGSYTWAWNSLDETKAEVVPKLPGALTTAKPRAETGDTPVAIEGAIGEKKDSGNLTIHYPAPYVVSYWPDCNEACPNAGVGTTFSSPVVSRGPIAIIACGTTPGCPMSSVCTTAPCPAGSAKRLEFSTFWSLDKMTMTLSPSLPLLPVATLFRVVLPQTSIRGLNGKALTDLNFDSDGISGLDAYSWTFTTKNSSCRLDRVSVEPAVFTAYLTNTPYAYTSVARGSPDACDKEGQRLNPLAYNWQWTTSNMTLARVTNRDVLPALRDGNADPAQDVTGKTEQRDTAITADAQGKKGLGTFTLHCGYGSDLECSTLPPPAGSLCPLEAGKPIACGVGSDTCCGARPKITGGPGGSDVCSNVVLTTLFNQNMDVSTFAGNIMLVEGGAPCPLNGNCPSAVRGEVLGVNVGGGSIGSFTPEANLKLDTVYTLQIVGDLFGGEQADTAKIRNKEGVALAGQRLFTFKTKNVLCPIDAVRIQIGRNSDPPKREDEDMFQCAGRDTCGDDSDLSKSGNQHTYAAEAVAEDGQTLKATYTWQPIEGDDILDVEAVKGIATVTPKPANGTAEVTVHASAPSAGSASRTVTVTNFICENSWPALSAFPWREGTTDFSLFYCRDAGGEGRGDDLPEIQYPPVDVKNSSIKKDLLLPVLQER